MASPPFELDHGRTAFRDRRASSPTQARRCVLHEHLESAASREVATQASARHQARMVVTSSTVTGKGARLALYDHAERSPTSTGDASLVHAAERTRRQWQNDRDDLLAASLALAQFRHIDRRSSLGVCIHRGSPLDGGDRALFALQRMGSTARPQSSAHYGLLTHGGRGSRTRPAPRNQSRAISASGNKHESRSAMPRMRHRQPRLDEPYRIVGDEIEIERAWPQRVRRAGDRCASSRRKQHVNGARSASTVETSATTL